MSNTLCRCWGAYDVGSSCKGSDNTVFGGERGTGNVGVSGFSVDSSGLVVVDEHLI